MSINAKTRIYFLSICLLMFLSSSCFSSSQGRNIKREEGNRIVKRNDSSPVSKYFNYISGKDYDKVKKLTEKNPKLVNSKNKNGYTPLSMVLGINSRMAIYLIKKGADVNGKFGDFGHTPLHFTNDIEVARLLVKRGAKVNEKTSYGMTPLHIAASPTFRFSIFSSFLYPITIRFLGDLDVRPN